MHVGLWEELVLFDHTPPTLDGSIVPHKRDDPSVASASYLRPWQADTDLLDM